MNDSQQRKRELLRDELLAFLSEARRLKFDADQLWRIVGRKLGCAPEDVLNELAFLVSAGLAAESYHGSGATKYYQATAAGVLAYERGD